MSPQRLYDKYKTHQISDADLIALIEANGAGGKIFHLLDRLPEQYEDLYTVLVDDRLVVRFEVPRTTESRTVRDFRIAQIAQYRNELGQGKHRIRLDQAIESARKLLTK